MANPASRRTFADRLNYLFETVRPPGQDRRYTNSEVARAAGVSDSHIGYLRSGQRDNPSMELIQRLAKHFRVRAGYLIEDELDGERVANVEEQLRLAAALENAGVRGLAMRAAEANLSAKALDTLTEMIEQVRRLDQAAGRGARGRRSRTD
jgi:transcriptional regulator with XRE-family HTH domain